MYQLTEEQFKEALSIAYNAGQYNLLNPDDIESTEHICISDLLDALQEPSSTNE